MTLLPFSEEWARTINVFTAVFAAIGVVAGGMWTVYQYEIRKTEELHNEFIQSISPVLRERMGLYLEASSVAATIATSQDEAQIASAKARFLILYHGPLRVILGDWTTGSFDPSGTTGVKRVNSSLSQIEGCIEAPKCRVSVQMSDSLAEACNADLVGQWLPPAPANLRVTAK